MAFTSRTVRLTVLRRAIISERNRSTYSSVLRNAPIFARSSSIDALTCSFQVSNTLATCSSLLKRPPIACSMASMWLESLESMLVRDVYTVLISPSKNLKLGSMAPRCLWSLVKWEWLILWGSRVFFKPSSLINPTSARTYGISTITTKAESEIDQQSGITAPDQNGDGGERVPKVIGVFDTSL